VLLALHRAPGPWHDGERVETAGVLDIPIVEVGGSPSSDLCRHDLERARALVSEVLGPRCHPLLPYAANLLDRLSHSWLVRQSNPYLGEIREAAAVLRRPGAYFLNTIYEWACSTSVAPDSAGGQCMIRVLDWGMPGLGRSALVARHRTAHGPFYSATWPGYAGVLTAMAPGRFSAAINQAPKMPVIGFEVLDELVTRYRVTRSRDAVPGTHLLRRTFERAPDYASAVAMLADESVALAMPTLFSLAGTEPGEGCVIEAFGRERRVHRSADAENGTLGVANQWLSPELRGKARNHAVGTGAATSTAENNRIRRAAVARLQSRDFRGAQDLPEPVLNSHTVMVVVANPRRGEMQIEGLEVAPGSILPRVVARRSIVDPPELGRVAANG
jgi:hypothetical protein